MDYLSDDEWQEPDSGTDNPLRRNEVAQTSRDAEVSEYAIDGPVIVGPGLPPEDGSCGQFAVQFHVTTTTVVGLKRIRIGQVQLGQLPPGQWRYLGAHERF
jgi:hypothetical protein